MKHDVVIIGGGLAGAACVRELERCGIDAVAFERERFPRRKVCGGFVSPGGVECLDRLGILQSVHDAGAVQVTGARVRVGSTPIEIPFRRPGIGISRAALDEIVARGTTVRQGCSVTEVQRTGESFRVQGEKFEVTCRVLIDAAGKLSRFSMRKAVREFGVQYDEAGERGCLLDFWFFEDGYGGAVSIEGARSNYCFLIDKRKLGRYLGRPHIMVTGPLAYDRLPGDFIAIGDAAGMVDPFCGEGIRHALDTGILAAECVARGIGSRRTYEEIRGEYESEWKRRWLSRRRLGAAIRRVRRYGKIFGPVLQFTPVSVMNLLWE